MDTFNVNSPSHKNLEAGEIRFAFAGPDGTLLPIPGGPKKKKTLSLCMIVKNEEAILSHCLDSVKDIVDEIVIIDTGSEDKTVEIAKSYTSNVFFFKWQNDFGKARSFSISKASGDWILILDADEIMDLSSGRTLRAFIEQTDMKQPFSPKIISYDDQGEVTTEHFHCRIIPNHIGLSYRGAIHEQVCHPDGKVVNSNRIPDIIIKHYGYASKQYEAKGKKERNLALLRKEIKKEKKNPFHYYNLQSVYYVDENYDKVISCFDYVRKYAKREMDLGKVIPYLSHSYSLTANAFFSLGKYDRAIQTGEEGLKISKDFPDLYYIVGASHYKMKNYDDAIKYCRSAVNAGGGLSPLVSDKSSSGWRTYKLLGLIYFDTGKWYDALDCYLKALVEIPKDHQVIAGIARCYDNLDRPEEAFQYYQKAVDTGPYCYPLYIWEMVDFIERFKTIDHAINLLDQYMKIYPEDPRGSLRKAEFCRKKSLWNESIQLYSYTLARMDNNVKIFEGLIYLNRGTCYYYEGNLSSAEEDFKKVIELDSAHRIHPYVNLGYIYIERKEYEKASHILKEARKYGSPGNSMIILPLAEAMIGSNEKDEAFNLLQEIAVSSKTDFIKAGFLRADYYMSLKDFSTAHSVIMNLLAFYDTDVDIYRYLTKILIAQGNFSTALSMYDCIIQLNPRDVSILLQKGKVLVFLKRLYEAKATFSRALAIEPENIQIKEVLQNVTNMLAG